MRGLVAPLIKLIIFVLVTVLAMAVLALTIANTNFTSTDDYRARFVDATSLNAGDDVRIAGVRVGQVKSVSIVDKHNAEVAFSVDKSVKVPSSVRAALRYRNIVGQRYLELDQSPGGDPNAVLKPGDTIPMEHTTPALDLTKLFNGFQPLFQALSPNDINQLSFEIVQVLQGEGSTINSLLGHTASLTSKLADKDAVIGKVITNLNSALGTINAHGPQVSQLIVTVQRLVSGFNQDRKPIGDAISTIGDLATTTSGFLQEGRKPLKDDIAQLGVLSKTLNKNQPTVEHFLQYLPGKVNRISRAGSYGSWFQFFNCQLRVKASLPGVIPETTLPVSQTDQPRCKG
jgi:phospholipid/cholesterol/gamma-HCH transport system substrate-binding protein